MDIANKIATTLNISNRRVAAAIDLFSDDNTIPFVARYRKEATGGLDEEQLRQISDLLNKLQGLIQRRETILKSIREQGLLDEALEKKILAAESLTELEDIYLPYKPKRRTRATQARERGLEPLSILILQQPRGELSIAEAAQAYLSDEVPTIEDAWSGARDIVAEQISENPRVRQILRTKAFQWGTIKVEKVPSAEDEKNQFDVYYEFENRIDRIRPHQILAINRGEHEKILRVSVMVPERDWREAIAAEYGVDTRSPLAGEMRAAIDDAAARLLLPAIERDVRRQLTEIAEEQAINVFAANLRALLSQPPLAGHTVMGIDPGFRTGCKVAVVDETGNVLATATIYPHEPKRQVQQSLAILKDLIEAWNVGLIAIGNGTASRETESLIAEFIQSTEDRNDLHYLIASEAGASVYSASTLAREELPGMDVSMRGAVSIARRVQDPLAELVKIDPKSIGVGMYQHDVDQKKLSASLDGVVESVVNRVGVDVNTASPALLKYVSGIGASLAGRVVAHRNEKGAFQNREEIISVRGLGPKAYEQAAGFLRIRGGNEPLDMSAIHPESYHIARQILAKSGITFDESSEQRQRLLQDFVERTSLQELSKELHTGTLTLEDILEQLARPSRDPREDLPKPILRSDVLKVEDLVVGMSLKGTVRNVVDFGAFIDIGVKQDGLLHVSQIPKGTKLHVGDILSVRILRIEAERGRIGLGWEHLE